MANLLLDRQRQQVRLNDHVIDLTPLEFEVLWVLTGFSGVPVSGRALCARLMDGDLDIDPARLQEALNRLDDKLPGSTRLRLDNGSVQFL